MSVSAIPVFLLVIFVIAAFTVFSYLKGYMKIFYVFLFASVSNIAMVLMDPPGASFDGLAYAFVTVYVTLPLYGIACFSLAVVTVRNRIGKKTD